MKAIVAHSEDTPPEIKDDGYILIAHIVPTEENGQKEEQFTAFAYPGWWHLFV